jgi:uncharacterized protein YjbJ (UPF0337 family)
MEVLMNWDRIAGKWKQAMGAMKTKWGKLTDDDFTAVAGKRDQLVGKIQEKYGIKKDEAEEQIEDFEREFEETNTSVSRPLN